MATPLIERGHAPPRTLDGIEEQYLFYLVSGSVRKQAQHFYNCIFEPIFNIPLEQEAKIAASTRAVKKGFLFNEGPFVKELDKALQGFGVHRQQHFGGAFVGNHVHAALKVSNINKLCTSILCAARENLPHKAEMVENETVKFLNLFTLFAKCHAIYDNNFIDETNVEKLVGVAHITLTSRIVMELCFVLLFALLMASSTFSTSNTECSLPNSVEGRGTVGAACIGDRVTFACNASSPSTLTLRWEHGGKVDDFYRNDDFPLRVVPPFNLTLMSSTPFLASVAELVVPAVFNAAIGAGISCFSRDASTQTLIKRGCVMLAAPPIVANIFPVSCTLSSVTVQWSAISAVGAVDGYALSTTQLQGGGDASYYGFVGPETNSYTLSNLLPGTWYNATAQGVVCNKTQYGSRNGVTFTVSVSQYPHITVCSVYNMLSDLEGNSIYQAANELRTIWNASIGAKLTGPQVQSLPCDVTAGYTVRYVCDQNAGTSASYHVDTASCGELCSHAYSVNLAPGSSCNVSVSSENLLLATATKRAEPANVLLSVKLASVIPPLSFACVLLSGLIGTSGCSISIGPSRDHLTHTSVSTRRGAFGENLVVTFDEAVPLQTSTEYVYEATLLSPSNDLQCVVARGSFTTGIWCSFEVAAGEQNKTACGPCDKGSRRVAVANGCVCYSGIVPGSKAYYTCDGGYGSGSRECLRDGKWSGAPLVCGNSSTIIQSSGATLGAADIAGVSVGVVIILLILLTVIGASLFMLRRTIEHRQRLETKRRIHSAGRKTSRDLAPAKNDQQILTIRVEHDGGHLLLPPDPPETVVYSTIRHC
ncbi:hypothetical protein EMCRGX_G011703 [Ephydatia muelleri]